MWIVLLVVLLNLSFFFVLGGALHWLFFHRRRQQEVAWKHQPGRFQSMTDMMDKLPLVLLNGLIIQLAIGVAIWRMVEGSTAAFWSLEGHSIGYVILSSVGLLLWYHVALYYVHRSMHHPVLFRWFHHLHHRAKSPMFLDALYEHPVEALWGAFVLTAPVFFVPVWAYAYFAFVALVGLHEILDHSGVRLNVPLLSASRDHDEHHRRSRVYYGQLLPFLDWLHGTDERDEGSGMVGGVDHAQQP